MIIYDKKMIIKMTKAHFKIELIKPIVYLSIIPKILSGTYFPMTALTSGKPILFLIKVKIRNVISTIAMKNIKDENRLKNMTTIKINTINTTKSMYVNPPLFSYLLYHRSRKFSTK